MTALPSIGQDGVTATTVGQRVELRAHECNRMLEGLDDGQRAGGCSDRRCRFGGHPNSISYHFSISQPQL
jgi:hypothetical protein